MRAYRDVEFGCHENDGKVFIHACESATVNLAYVNGPGLHQLLEHDAVVTVLASSNAHLRHFRSDGKVFIHACESATVNLAYVNGPGLHQLLEHDAVVTVLASSNAHLRHFTTNARVAENVIRAGWLFHPPGVDFSQSASALDGFADVPLLVGIHH